MADLSYRLLRGLNCFAELHFCFKNNFYKKSQPEISYCEIGILKNIHAGCKLIRKTKRSQEAFQTYNSGGS